MCHIQYDIKSNPAANSVLYRVYGCFIYLLVELVSKHCTVRKRLEMQTIGTPRNSLKNEHCVHSTIAISYLSARNFYLGQFSSFSPSLCTLA
jgi:hypothetical protein